MRAQGVDAWDAARIVLGFLDAARRCRKAKAHLRPRGAFPETDRCGSFGEALRNGGSLRSSWPTGRRLATKERRMGMSKIKIAVELEDEEARAYAQFLKRVLLDDYEQRAADDEEAYLMRDAGLKVQQALAEAGYAPR